MTSGTVDLYQYFWLNWINYIWNFSYAILIETKSNFLVKYPKYPAFLTNPFERS